MPLSQKSFPLSSQILVYANAFGTIDSSSVSLDDADVAKGFVLVHPGSNYRNKILQDGFKQFEREGAGDIYNRWQNTKRRFFGFQHPDILSPLQSRLKQIKQLLNGFLQQVLQ